MRNVSITGYEMLGKLGDGAMGSVYRARQISLDRIVAIKIMSSHLAERPDLVERFQREAKAAAKLKHSGIVQVFEAGKADDCYYFAMEFVNGYSVGDWIKRKGRLNEKDVLDVGYPVACAMEYAWEKAGIIHRDIKPDNILIDEDGTIKVADLGLVKASGIESSVATMSGVVMGTPCYCSPEQAQGEPDLDSRTDIYSLGAMMYHCVTGCPPFGAGSGMGAIVKHVTDFIYDPRAFNPDVSDGFVWLVEKMMIKQRDLRHADWGEVVRDMEHVRDTGTPAGDWAAYEASTMKVGYIPQAPVNDSSVTMVVPEPKTEIVDSKSGSSGGKFTREDLETRRKEAVGVKKSRKTTRTRKRKNKVLGGFLFLLLVVAAATAVGLYHAYKGGKRAMSRAVKGFMEEAVAGVDSGEDNKTEPVIPSGDKTDHDRSVPSIAAPERFVFGGIPKKGFFPHTIKVLENKAFLVGYCDEIKNPVWVAYRLFKCNTDVRKRPAQSLRFSVDDRTKARVSLEDYKIPETVRGNYTTGQLALYSSIADCYGEKAAAQTFLLSNVTPQLLAVRTRIWSIAERRMIENVLRRQNELWVICGPIFSRNSKRLPSGVVIPVGLYKIVALDRGPHRGLHGMLIPQNPEHPGRIGVNRISVDKIEAMTGLDFFPDLPDEEEERLESDTSGWSM